MDMEQSERQTSLTNASEESDVSAHAQTPADECRMQGAHAQCMEADAQVEAPVCGVSKAEVVVTSLQAELADCRAQVEHWQGVATICEMSKQEELAELQRRCDQEVESLQEALRETASQYEARISALQAECSLWRKGGGSIPPSKGISQRAKGGDGALLTDVQQEKATAHPDGCADGRPEGRDGDAGEGTDEEPGSQMGENGDNEGGLSLTEGYFARHCDTTSLSSFSLDTPSLPRRPPPQEDTASLVSTGTLVPEAIYLPPPGYRLVTLSDWDALHTQLAELQAELARVREERAELERELGTQSSETQRQVTMLQSQVQNSEALLQDLQKSFAQSQNAVQRRLAELSLSHRKVCSKLSRLKGGEAAVGAVAEDERVQPTDVSLALQGAHCEERLRIEIVNLREQLEQRTEESEVLEGKLTVYRFLSLFLSLDVGTWPNEAFLPTHLVRLSSLKTETDRIQGQNEKLQQELQACRTELTGLQVALSHLQRDNKAQSSEKSLLEQQCLELRSQMISLRSQLDTSQAVQRDFVQLSQSLQVKMELIRQAESMDQVREVLEEGPSDDSSKVTDTL
uniref:Rab GTPase-binding effector protein 2 n=1 Tax=Scleropages formosus TaxID=113540 RepID=A0A8C9QRD7_SCLFO